MSENRKTKRVCVMLSKWDYEKVSDLAKGECRTVPAYMRWLLHRHFRELDKESRLQNENQPEA